MRTILENSIIFQEQIEIIEYQIITVTIVPNTSVSIYLYLFGKNNKIYERLLIIDGELYLQYTDDSFLYNYINKNIENIYNN